MNLKSIGWIVCTIILFHACTTKQKKTETVELQSITDTLHANILSVKGETEMVNPQQVKTVSNDYLVVIDDKKEGIFQVFRLPELIFLYSFGSVGSGPNEFSTFISYNTITDVQDNQLLIYESALGNIEYYTVTDTTMVLQKNATLSYTNQTMQLNGVEGLNDSTLVAFYGITPETNTDKEFIALRPDSEDTLFTFGSYPKTELEGVLRAQDFYKATTAKPDGSKFVAFYSYHQRFRIYDNKGTLLKDITINDPHISVNSEDKIIYRNYVEASDNYIYVFAPHTTRDGLSAPDEIRPIIEIWDWNGEFVRRFMLDKPVKYFTVSEAHGKLYGITNYTENVIYEYDLKSN